MDMVISPVNVDQRKTLDLRAGDTVRVHQKIQEKDKTRIEVFEGLVLSRKHGREAGGTFTVRRVFDGVGVEKIFPLYSPNIETIEVVRRSKVKRSKLYHVREKAAKEIRRQMRNIIQMDTSSSEDKTPETPEEAVVDQKEKPEAIENKNSESKEKTA